MLNNQDFMGRSVGSFAVKDQGLSERERSDEDRVIIGEKWYFDQDQTYNHIQLVPEIHKEEEKSNKDLLAVVVPDEHSQTDDHHGHSIKDFSYGSNNRSYLRNKHDKTRKRRIKISSDEELDDFTREVPSVTRTGFKRRRRRRNEMCDKMRVLQHLVPNCHKTDKVLLVLDKTIEYMKNLQLQLKVMSIMGMNNPYFTPVTSDFGMQNHMLTAMSLQAHGQNPVNQTTSPLLIPALNWPIPPFTNLSFSRSSISSPASSPQCLCSFVPYFPSPLDFSSNSMGRL